MSFMNSEVYGMIDELGLLMAMLEKRKRPSLLPEGLEALFSSLIDAITGVADAALQAMTELWQAIAEVVASAVRALSKHITPWVEFCRRSQLYKHLKRAVGERAAWYLAEHWPRRWLPRWRKD